MGITFVYTLCSFDDKVYSAFLILGVIAKKQVKEFRSNYLAPRCIIPCPQRLYRPIDQVCIVITMQCTSLMVIEMKQQPIFKRLIGISNTETFC